MSYQQSELYHLLEQNPPPVNQIKQALESVEPALVAELVENEPEVTFLVDYYFRLLPDHVGARVVSAPEFTLRAALELFNCQILRYQRRSLHSDDYDVAYASMMESYWREVNPEKLTQIFQEMLNLGKSNHFAALMILQQMDLDNLVFMQQQPQFRSKAMLALFKDLGGNVRKLISENLDLFDFVYRLASDVDDQQYLGFLDEFTSFIMEIRIARTLADDAARRADERGKVPLNTLVHLLDGIPDESRRMTLELLRQRGHIDPGLMQGLMQLQADLKK